MKKLVRIFTVAFLCSVLLSGCGLGSQPAMEKESGMENSTGMGGYQEKTTNLKERFPYAAAIGKSKDGKTYLLDTRKGLFEVNQDGPQMKESTRKLQKGIFAVTEKSVVLNTAISPEGKAAVIYTTEDSSGEDMVVSYAVVDLEGQVRTLTLPGHINADGISKFWYKEDGRLFGTTSRGQVYEVKEEEDSRELLFDFGSSVGHVSFLNQKMILINGQGIFFYDLDNKEWLEDETASKFVAQECSWEALSDDQYTVLAFPGEDDSFYIACEKGLYRHVFGGSTMEMVIDGSMCSLGNEAQRLMGMVRTENNEFAALQYGGTFSYFLFDPNTSTVPQKTLTVYSLRDNDLLRQTMHSYQSDHPGVLVKMEIGLPANSNATREDAVKILNTELMAGKGPDVLFLDELPLDNYINKGILKDISPVLRQAEQEAEYYTNITNMYQTDKGTYAVPTLYRMAYMVGDKDKIEKINDLESLADMIEQLRAENPEGDLIGLVNEKQIIQTLAMACAPAWKDQDGNIDRDAITQFLTQAKRIYEAQTVGLREQDIEYQAEASSPQYSDTLLRMYASYQMATFGCEYTKMMLGFTEWCLGYSAFPALEKRFADREVAYAPFVAQCDNVFFPHSIIGINAAAAEQELADEFLRLALSRKVQDVIQYGFPVNKETMEAKINKEVGIYFGAAPRFGSPTSYSIWIDWASPEEFAELEKNIMEADTAYVMGGILEDVMLELGPKALNGENSIDTVVNEIVSRAGIYMTE